MSEKPEKTPDETPEVDETPEEVAEEVTDEVTEEITEEVDQEDPQILEMEPELTVEEQLQAEIQRLESEVLVQRDRQLRTVAEMDNLRKRTRREVADSRRFAQAELLRPLLEVIDNFDRALQHAPEDADESAELHASFREGVSMIAKNLHQVLQDRGVKPIIAAGCSFDPAQHEAVGQQPADEENESGSIMAVVQEGYTLGDLVLRPSRVIVAQ